MAYIECKNISYSIKNTEISKIIDNVSFEVNKGDFVIILGKSGSGKTTLLNILVGLIHPTNGDVLIEGNNFTNMTDDEKTYWRRYRFGYIFQNYGLFETLNIYDNIALSLDLENLYSSHAKKYFNDFKNNKKKLDYKIIDDVMKQLKINHLWNKFPHELSGGQQQRVSIARILVKKPEIVFADEPTGALDSEISNSVMNAIKDMNENGSTIIMITHNQNYIKYANKIIHISDGKILSIENKNKEI